MSREALKLSAKEALALLGQDIACHGGRSSLLRRSRVQSMFHAHLCSISLQPHTHIHRHKGEELFPLKKARQSPSTMKMTSHATSCFLVSAWTLLWPASLLDSLSPCFAALVVVSTTAAYNARSINPLFVCVSRHSRMLHPGLS